jgi:hypothetical protein
MLGYDDLHDYNNHRGTDYEYNNDTLSEIGSEFMEKFIALPVYKFEHGLVKLSTGSFSCPWDSGQVGYIYVPEEKMDEVDSWTDNLLNGRTKREAAEDILRKEIETFSEYINGEVYGFRVEEVTKCECCGSENVEILDSMAGFYGDDFMNNGMADYLSENGEELVEQLKDYSYEDIVEPQI